MNFEQILIECKTIINDYSRQYGQEPDKLVLRYCDYDKVVKNLMPLKGIQQGITQYALHGIKISWAPFIPKIMPAPSVEYENWLDQCFIETDRAPVCECGAVKAGSPSHAHYCPIFSKN